MKTLKGILTAMHYRGHISVRRRIYNETIYIGGGSADSIIDRFGGYRVEYMEVMDSVLIIYVN